MAPPLPPPGVPPRAGLAPRPTAVLSLSTLLRTTQETPMLLSALPLAHTPPSPEPPPNVLFTTYTGAPWHWLSTRSAAPPRPGPAWAPRVRTEPGPTDLN